MCDQLLIFGTVNCIIDYSQLNNSEEIEPTIVFLQLRIKMNLESTIDSIQKYLSIDKHLYSTNKIYYTFTLIVLKNDSIIFVIGYFSSFE